MTHMTKWQMTTNQNHMVWKFILIIKKNKNNKKKKIKK